MSRILDLIPSKVVACDDRTGSVSVTSGSGDIPVVSFQTKIGFKCWVVVMATNTILPTNSVLWNLKADKAKLFPYSDMSVSPSDPSLWTFLPFPVPVGQNTLVEISAANSSGGTGTCTARLVVFYSQLLAGES